MKRYKHFFISCIMMFVSLFAYNIYAAPPVAKSGNFVISPTANTNLNILRDCSYECGVRDITITITTPPTYGTVTINAITKLVTYRHTTPGLFNEDSFQYTITCYGETSTPATIYLHPGTKPDNMIDDVCHIDPTGFTWQFGTPQSSTEDISVIKPWLVGDLDNNGIPEIVASKDYLTINLEATYPGLGSAQALSSQLIIFRDGDINDAVILDLKAKGGEYIGEYWGALMGYIGLSRFNDGVGAIVGLGADGLIYAYEYPSLDLRYKSTEKWTQVKNGNYGDIRFSVGNIGFADFDGDGKIEVYTGNKIFSLDGLNYLTGLGATDNQGFTPQYGYDASKTTAYGGGASVAADVNGDGRPELIAGNAAYLVKNNSGTWNMSLYKQAPSLTIQPYGTNTVVETDGRTSLADFNGDGHIDVLVSYTTNKVGSTTGKAYCVFYGWDIYNNRILFSYVQENTYCLNYPLIGDMTGDGKLNIGSAFGNNNAAGTGQDGYSSDLRVFALPSTFGPTAKLTNPWTLAIDESATRTGISLFDFNLDGKMELVYRDQMNLRIMNLKSDGTIEDLITYPAGSATTYEMAIVADMDNDGAAEIICASGPTDPYRPSTGKMQIFKSGNAYNWAPARKVWNQYAYNPTFVNEDLTVPTYALNMATKLTDNDGIVRTPFNNFLQQAPIMNMDGVSLNAGANLTVSSAVRLSYNSGTDAMTVSFTVTNNGNLAFKGTIPVSLYVYNETTQQYTLIGTTYTYGTAASVISINGSVDISYNISGFSSLLPATYDKWFLSVNAVNNAPNAPTYFAGQKECKEGDNLTSRISLVSKELVLCEDSTAILELPDNYSYRWYDTNTSTTPLTTVSGSDNKLQVTKDANQPQLYFVSTYRKNNYTQPISNIRDTVFVYLAADTLIWTGLADNGDWHDYMNWKKPDNIICEHPRSNIPVICTDVIIPDGIANYPDLSTMATNYTDYNPSACNDIIINHGGEVTMPDKLTYSDAYVDITLEANRWYMFSPPLKNFYSGDIYVNDPNPFNDDVIIYSKLFAQANPQNGYLVSSWTGNYNNPEYELTLGQGARIWTDDKGDDPDLRTPFSFRFPKDDMQYHIYGPEGNIWYTRPVPTRDDANRFIFDGLPNASTGDFSIPTPGAAGTGLTKGQLWLVGNPFMAHLDFSLFFAANSSKIKNLYRIMTEDGNYEYYNTGANTLPQYIAPMQSFIVETRDDIASVTTLTMNGSMTLNRAGIKLKSIAENQAQKLSISLMDASRNKRLSQIYIIAEEGASNAYDGNEDVSLMTNPLTDIADEPSVLFSKSIEAEPRLLSVNRINSEQAENTQIPLGIRAVKENQPINLLIQGQWDFAPIYELFLYDKLTDKNHDLRADTWFLFDNSSAQTLLDDRFVIKIGNSVNSIGQEEDIQNEIIVFSQNRNIYVRADGQIIDSVEIYDIQGRIIASAKAVNSESFSTPLYDMGMAIVKVVTDKSATVKKVLIK